MNLIKNDDFQEEPAMTTITPDDELDDLFSFDDDPNFLSTCEEGHAELRRLVLDRLSAEDDDDRHESHGRTAAPNNNIPAELVPSSWIEVAPSSLNRRPTFRLHRIPILAAAAAAALMFVIGAGLTSFIVAPAGGTETTSASSVQAAPPIALPPFVPVGPPSPGDVHNAASTRPDAEEDIRFAPNSSVLSPDARATINQVTALLASKPYEVTVTGFAAAPPGSTPEGRIRLAEARARAVAAALVESGVEPARIDIAASESAELSSLTDGGFDEKSATEARRVQITYQ